MNLKKTVAWSLVSPMMLSSAAMAQAAAALDSAAVLTLTEISPPGKALVEMPNGQRLRATAGMQLPHGSQLYVLENATVHGFYNQTGCKVRYEPQTRLQVSNKQICAAGTKLARNTKVVKTTDQVIVDNGAGYVRPTGTPIPSRPLGGFRPLAGLVGGGILLTIAHQMNDDDNPSDQPISP